MGDLPVPHRLIKVLSFDKTLHGLCGHETVVLRTLNPINPLDRWVYKGLYCQAL